MKTSVSVGLGVTIAIALLAGPGYSDEILVEELHGLNTKIEAAFAEGRQWTKVPGGLSAFLFGSESVVGPGEIFFPAGKDFGKGEYGWLRAHIYKSDHGPCLISHIEPCDKEAAREYIDRRDFLRKASKDRIGFDYVTDGPLDLLNILKAWEGNYFVSPIYQFGWVKESDLLELVKLLDSTEPCANVQAMHSSFIDTTKSTVGNEAAYLIEGFRMDHYPPSLNSTRPPCDIEKIKAWWEERSGA